MRMIDIKSKVYALYDKSKKYPCCAVMIEPCKNSINIVTAMPFKFRLIFAWYILRHQSFTIRSHYIEEKNEKEIEEYNSGKGLKRRQIE